MILKNTFMLSDGMIKILNELAEPHIHSLCCQQITYDVNENTYISKSIHALIEEKSTNQYHKFILNPLPYVYNNEVDNEIDTFYITSMNTDLNSIRQQFNFGSGMYFENSTNKKIQSISIYGEERTRTWDKKMIEKYFGEKIELLIGDYLFAPQYLLLQLIDEKQIVFKVERGVFSIKITSEFEKTMYTGNYDYSQLHKKEEEDWYEKRLKTPFDIQIPELPNETNEKIIKKETV